MIDRTRFARFRYFSGFIVLAALAVGCGEGADAVGPDGAVAGTGGAPGSGGNQGTGGVGGTGGGINTGGAPGSGGAVATGGASGTGGMAGTGGSSSTGGSAGTGTGGAGAAGGVAGTGGAAGGGAGAGVPSVRLDGRIDYSDQARPMFSWSGSAMVARFQGTGATLRIDGSPNQFQVILDGVSSKVLKVVSGTSQYALVTGLPAAAHNIVVWRRTEGNLGDNRFLGLDVTGGQLQAPPAAPDRRVEIYGDSITAGYGMDGVGPSCPHSPDTDNHYLTYGAVMARALSVDLHTVAWSGIGMYRNYNVAGASPDAMPSVYARTLADNTTKAWDFSRWQPHAVVINLGTNDFSTKGDPGMPYRTAYLEFVRALRTKYPKTFFILSIGPMLDGANLTAVRGHLQAIMQTRAGEGDPKVSYLEFPTQIQADGYGCDYHPSPSTNMKMATALTAELKAHLGW